MSLLEALGTVAIYSPCEHLGLIISASIKSRGTVVSSSAHSNVLPLVASKVFL